MTFQQGQSGNPSGNPNVIEDTKGKQTGPKTYEGKLRSTIKRGLLKTGKSSKLVRERSCDTCPLRPKTLPTGITINSCLSYESGQTSCPLDIVAWVERVKFYLMSADLGEAEALRFLAAEAYANATQANHFETVTQGRPGMMGLAHMKLVMDALGKAGDLRVQERKITPETSEKKSFSMRDILQQLDRMKDGHPNDNSFVIEVPSK